MKALNTLAAAAFTALLAVPAVAGNQRSDGAYYDYAKVVSAVPIVRREVVNNPRRECWREQVRVRTPRRDDPVPVILGGSLGGLLGHQFGDGNARDVLTVAGALLGASVANEVSSNRRARRGDYETRDEERCEVIDDYSEIEHIDGWDVTYRYRGQTFTRRMDQDPGERVRIRVSVTPTYERGAASDEYASAAGHHHDRHTRHDDYKAVRYQQRGYRNRDWL